MTVTAIIPHWNRRELLVSLLGDLQRQSRPVHSIIVVDNGSTDASPEVAERAGARVIRLARNCGFAYAVNRGIAESTSEWVAVLNNDVHLRSDWLERLLAGASHPQCWFAAGKLLSAHDPAKIDGCFDLLARSACAWRAGSDRLDGPEWSEPRTVHFIPFTAAIFRRSLFEKVGLLDETFESYLEDVDFGLRCAFSGCSGRYVPDAVALHEGSATLGAWNPETVRRIARNQLLLVAKHYPPDWIRRYGWPVLAGQLLWGLVALRHGAGAAFLRGKLGGLRSLRNTERQVNSKLADILVSNEQQIRQLQQRTGYDRFWRLYFALT